MRRGSALRRLIFHLHLYVGLSVGALLAIIGLTGSALVFAEELDAWLNPHLHHAAPSAVGSLSLEKATQRARRFHPAGRIIYVRMPRAEGGTYEFWFDANDGLRVYVHPSTGEIRGARVWRESLVGRIYGLHSELLGGKRGETALGICAALLLLLGATGLVLWWPGGRRLSHALRINWSGNRKRVVYDLHNIVGFFASAFLTVSAITGLYLVFDAPFARAINRLTASAPRSTPRALLSRPSLDDVLRAADQALPGAPTTYIGWPKDETAPFVVRKRFPAELHPNGRSFVYVDQYDGEVLLVENALRSPLGTRLVNLFYPIHIGLWGGLPTRILQALIGLTPAVLFITGLLMWRNRTRKRRSPVT